jgi:hypothetical protein
MLFPEPVKIVIETDEEETEQDEENN